MSPFRSLLRCRRVRLPRPRLVEDRSGASALVVALTFTGLIGAAGLGSEAASWYSADRNMQGAADAAAASAVAALNAGASSTRVVAEAKAMAAANGFTDGLKGVTITVNQPPSSGSYAGASQSVEVIIRQPHAPLFSSLFLTSGPVLAARAVGQGAASGVACILGLDTSVWGTVQLSNNAYVSDPNCGIADNSSSSSALTMSNNAIVKAPVEVHGRWALSNNAELDGSRNQENAPVVPDPYSDVQMQPVPGCTGQTSQGKNNVTLDLTPGHFCSGLDFQNNATVNLAPGTYYVDQKLVFGNNVVVNGTGGVTLVVRGNYAIDLGNNAQINITAPASGPYAGLAFFGDRNGTPWVQQTFSNNTILNIKGAVYFPNQVVEFDNNAETTPGGCTQIIGREVHLSNNVQIDANCTGVGTRPIDMGGKVALVE